LVIFCVTGSHLKEKFSCQKAAKKLFSSFQKVVKKLVKILKRVGGGEEGGEEEEAEEEEGDL
jgi:hypothetical protein